MGDYIESKIREDNGDRDHEIEEKAKEQVEAGGAAPAADPIVPLDSGTSSSSAPRSVPEPRALGPDSRPKRTEKKAKTANTDASNIQKRPRGQEVDKSEKTARQNGLTDVSTATASSSSTSIAPRIPIGPNMRGAAKRELGYAHDDDDEAPEKS